MIGLSLSLLVGLGKAKELCREGRKPLIPVHHMKAHSLTARLLESNVDFPFLVLLISGGHCLLALAKSIDEFVILGQTIDDAPGEAFDKVLFCRYPDMCDCRTDLPMMTICFFL